MSWDRSGPVRAASPARRGAVAPPVPGVGNRALALLLQRQTAELEQPLTAGQAARAVGFYRGRPDIYPATVITRIQVAVKSPPTGVADADMAQAVARWQRGRVKVDGMAGPRTLPRMFESGLATKESRKAYVAEARKVPGEWEKLGTPQARAEAFFAAVQPVLEATKVTLPKVLVADGGGAKAFFTWEPWTITMDLATMSATAIDESQARDIASAMYHEARHAEQHHKMARMLATKGDDEAEIAAKMSIPDHVAKDAHDLPLPRGVEFATADQQYASVYGPGRAHFTKSEKEAPTKAQLDAARAAYEADPTPANKAELDRLTAAHVAYHDLPTEHDAHETAGDEEVDWEEAAAAKP